MGDLLALLAYAIVLAVILAGLAWLASRVRRRGIGGGIMGPVDEIYHPSAHRLRFEIEAHEQRTLPMPSAE